jgi:carotenoid cleavage dioxygenase
VVRDTPIAVEHGPCIHDCALTARFAVVLDLPVTFSMRAVLGGHLFPFRWNRAHRARVGLLPRHGDATGMVWCDVEPCFVFHVANAFDGEDGRVVLDVIAYPAMFVSGGSGLDALGRFERWTVDPTTRRVDRRLVDHTPQEFPRIDERRFGQSYRYAYAVSVPPDGDPQLTGATRLYKHDLRRAAAVRTTSATVACRASSCSCRRPPTRVRTKAGSSASSSTRRTRPPTS